MVKRLLRAGHEVVTLDNLSAGHRDAVTGGVFIEGDLADTGALRALFAAQRPEAVMHFASCIRDYVHVDDLCAAHLLALEWMRAHDRSAAFNLGNGAGFSVQEVIAVAERVSGRRVPVVDAQRRAGDPARLVADATRARRELGWAPRHPDLESIIGHAWRWECRQAGLA